MLQTCTEYFFSFFGTARRAAFRCHLPAARASQIETTCAAHAGSSREALTEILITVPPAKRSRCCYGRGRHAQERSDTVNSRDRARSRWRIGEAARNRHAAVHLGEHGHPKGVILTHYNLLSNIRAMGQALRATPAMYS